MSTLEKLALPAIAILASVTWVMSLVMDPQAFGEHWAIREDGLLEMFTFFALAGCSALCFYRGWTLRGQRSAAFVAALFAGSALLAFGAGEEISWGQRIFSVPSPEFFQVHNAQGETNLHNMVVGGVGLNKLIFGKVLAGVLIAYLVGLPLAYHRSEAVRRQVDALALPVPRTHHTLSILAIVAMVETSSAGKRGEINEFAISSILLLILLNSLNSQIFRRNDQQPALATDSQATTGPPAATASHTTADPGGPRRREAPAAARQRRRAA